MPQRAEATVEQQLVLPIAAEAQSPFLQGTNVQFAWDSTSLELFKRCPRLYQYTMIEGYEPQGEAIHLRFGIEYHQALHDYEEYRANGAEHDRAVHSAVRSLLLRTRDWNPDPRTKSEEQKTKANLVRAVVWYLDKFEDDPAKTVILDDGRPALEVSFRFELDIGPHPQQQFILCGHLDRVVEYQESVFVMDRKTTTYSLGPWYFNQWAPHNQMSLYTIAGKVVLETPVRGVIIDAVKVGEKPEFQRGVTYRTQDQMDEWLYELSYWFQLAEGYAAVGHWPMNDTSCDKYGGCRFREICSKSPAARQTFLRSGFRKLEKEERWNPLKPR